MNSQFDVAIIGGGIVGLAQAWMAARRGLRVILLERSPAARGASVRNFGMIWPIGQPAGELYSLALRSREFWLELRSQGVVDVEECGSVHLAHRPDELAVLEEFCHRRTHEARLLTRDEVVRETALANPEGLLRGMASPTELRVNPRTASARIAAWLAETLGMSCCFQTLITHIDDGEVRAADGRRWRADRIIVCGGSDLQTLYQDIFRGSELQLCKLQMLRSVAQPAPSERRPHVASGLTLRHYQAFATCPSLAGLRARIAAESPELDQFGIHVMASQSAGGEVILGDSHEYDVDITPFDKMQIDELILRELRKVIRLTDWTIQERWHGVYARHPTLPVFETEAADGTHIFTGTGGAGMTMALGLADRAWERWTGADS